MSSWKAVLPAMGVLAFSAPALGAQPTIVHERIECITPGRFALIVSVIDPESEIESARVYFRSELYPDFYYVEMTREPGRFTGILPQVSAETRRILYYVEAVNHLFESNRSQEFSPLVKDCDAPAASFTGGEPQITVGATAGGASAIPPGFTAAGIVSTITSAGIVSGVAGGISAGVAVGGAAAAAGAAGAVVVASGSQSTTTGPVSTTTVPPVPSTTTVPSPTSSVPSTTTTVPGTSTTTVPDTTTTTAPGPTTSTSPTTSTTSSTTTTAPPLDAGCFLVESHNRCMVKVDAKCVAQPVDRYDWVLDTENRFRRVAYLDGEEKFVHEWSFGECDQDETLTIQLTVWRAGVSSTSEKTILVPAKAKAVSGPERVAFQIASSLELSGSGRGRILLDGTLAGTIASGETLNVRRSTSSGVHRIEAVLTTREAPSGEPGIWSFDFRNAPGVAVEKLRVVDGTVLATGPSTIRFRLNGDPGERVLFDFQLE